MARSSIVAVGLALSACLNVEDVQPEGVADGGVGGSWDAAGDATWADAWQSSDAQADSSPQDASPEVATSDGGPCTPDSPQLLDDFGLPDGPIGSAWSGDRDSFAIVAGRLRRVKAGQDDRILYSKVLCATQSASVRLVKIDPLANMVGLMFATGTDNNCGHVQFGYSGLLQSIRIQRCNNGKWTDLAAVSFQMADGDLLSGRVEQTGALTVSVNGAQVASVNLGSWPGGRPGIAIWGGGTSAELDDFKGG